MCSRAAGTEVRFNHKRTGLGLISAVTSKGELRWMVLDGAIKAPALLRFLARQKVFLILDRLPVHRSAKLCAWLAGREDGIEVFYLPGYSPELNPDEGGNGDLKQVVTCKAPARSETPLKRAVVGHMRKLSKSPRRVRSLFGNETFRYVAWFKITQAGSIRISQQPIRRVYKLRKAHSGASLAAPARCCRRQTPTPCTAGSPVAQRPRP